MPDSFALDDLLAAGGQPDATPDQTVGLDALVAQGGQPDYNVPSVPAYQPPQLTGSLLGAIRPPPALRPAGIMEQYQGTDPTGLQAPLPPILATPAPGGQLDPSQLYQPPASQSDALATALATASGLAPGVNASFAPSTDPNNVANFQLQERAGLDLGYGAPARQYVDAVGKVADLSKDVTPLYEARKQATLARLAAGDKATAAGLAIVNVGPDGSPTAPTSAFERSVRDRAGAMLSDYRNSLANQPDDRAAGFGTVKNEAYDLGDGRILVSRKALAEVSRSAGAGKQGPSFSETPDFEKGLNAAGIGAAKAIGGIVQGALDPSINQLASLLPDAIADPIKGSAQASIDAANRDAQLQENRPEGAPGFIAQAAAGAIPLMGIGATPLGPAYAAAMGFGGAKADVGSALRSVIDPATGKPKYTEKEASDIANLAGLGSAALNYGLFKLPGFRPTADKVNDVAGAFAHGAIQSTGTAFGENAIRSAATGQPFEGDQVALEGLIGGLTAGGLRAIGEGFRSARQPRGPVVDDPSYEFGTPRRTPNPPPAGRGGLPGGEDAAPPSQPRGLPPGERPAPGAETPPPAADPARPFHDRMADVADAVDRGDITWDEFKDSLRWVQKEGRPLSVGGVTVTPADVADVLTMFAGKVPPRRPASRPPVTADDPIYEWKGPDIPPVPRQRPANDEYGTRLSADEQAAVQAATGRKIASGRDLSEPQPGGAASDTDIAGFFRGGPTATEKFADAVYQRLLEGKSAQIANGAKPLLEQVIDSAYARGLVSSKADVISLANRVAEIRGSGVKNAALSTALNNHLAELQRAKTERLPAAPAAEDVKGSSDRYVVVPNARGAMVRDTAIDRMIYAGRDVQKATEVADRLNEKAAPTEVTKPAEPVPLDSLTTYEGARAEAVRLADAAGMSDDDAIVSRLTEAAVAADRRATEIRDAKPATPKPAYYEPAPDAEPSAATPNTERQQRWVAQLTNEEQQAFAKWANTKGAQQIIEYQRTGVDPTPDKQAAPRSAAIERALAKGEPEPGTIYRGLKYLSPEDHARLSTVGATVDNRGAISSWGTDRPAVERDFTSAKGGMLFRVRDNRSGVSLGDLSSIRRETEVLVPRATKYRVTAVEPTGRGDRMLVDLEEFAPLAVVEPSAKTVEKPSNQPPQVPNDQQPKPEPPTVSPPAARSEGEPGPGAVGEDGGGALAGGPARPISPPQGSGNVEGRGDDGGAGGDRPLRRAGGERDGGEGGEGDRPERVRPAPPADGGGGGGGAGQGGRVEPARSAGEHAGRDVPSLAGDHVIRDADQLHAGGMKQKFKDNVAAIETLREIEAAGRGATPDEQAALAKFVGWGAMPGAFNRYGQDAGAWAKERDVVAGLLSPEEFAAAAKSTLNAHYTSGPIVSGMWRMADALGFSGGRVLEPSMGVGNFFGLMPAGIKGRSTLTGVELDTLTGRIAKLLYPSANVMIRGFEAVKTPKGFFDFVVSNFPFGDYKIHDPAYNRFGAPIHDYFFLKSVDQTRPGGIVMGITSTGTMDKGSARIREALAAKADLVAAIRLPEGAFQANAGTAVVTDLLILKRRPDGAPPAGPEWTKIASVPDPDGGDPIPINEYFLAHPEQVLGTVDRKSRLYGRNSPHVSATPDFQQRWEDAIGRIPKGVYEPPSVRSPASAAKPTTGGAGRAKDGGYVRGEGGRLLRRSGDVTEAVEGIPPKTRKIISSTLKVRDALRDVIDGQLAGKPEAELSKGRKALGAAYDAFVKEHGPLHKAENVKAFSEDPDAPVVLALEEWNPKTKTATKADAFTQNTVRGYERPTKAADPGEAVGISLNETARIDVDRIGELLGITPAEAGKRLVKEGLAFEDPAAGWQSADQYLSGNVLRKLVEAKAAAEHDADKYGPNVKALEKVQPADIPYDEIDARLGVPWIGPDDVADFAAHVMGGRSDHFSIRYLPSAGEWFASYSVPGARIHGNGTNDVQVYGTGRASFEKVLEATLNNKAIEIKDKVSSNPDRYVLNTEETAAARDKMKDLQDRFAEWVWNDDDRRARLHRFYNDTFNNLAAAKFDGSHLRFPGMVPEMNGKPFGLRDHQRDAVWRTITTGTALYAHEVGTGKTFTIGAAAMELRRLGLARKPAVAVLKSTLPGFTREVREQYPTAKILSIEKFDPKNRKETVSRIATGDYDIVILTHDVMNMLPMRKETQAAFVQRELDELAAVITSVEEETGERAVAGKKRGGGSDNRLVKKLENAKAKLEARLKEALDSKQDDAITFEETGIDHLFVDEAHEYKSLPVYTKQDRIKGIPTSRSDRATSLWMRSRWLQEQNGGRGVVFATGTPITNTMSELYTMQRYLQSKELEERGVAAFDAWARNFGEISTRDEVKVSGEYEPVARFSKFVNLPELAALAGQVIDVQRASSLPGFKRPGRKDELTTVPMTAAQDRYKAEIRQRAAEAKQKRPGEKGDNMLSISTDARKAALDMRLVDRNADERDSGKLAKVAAEVVAFSKANPGKTQMIFSDVGVNPTDWGFSAFGEIVRLLVEGGIPRDKIINFSDLADVQKRTASSRLKSGDALVGIGSTKTMGTGVNAQDSLAVLHHVDVPWLPGSVEQRDGRGWRQGNKNASIAIRRYTTLGSFDTFMWQTVDTKSRFIQQFIEAMSGKGTVARTAQEEDGEELTPAQIMAVTSGNPLLLDKINLDREVRDLERAARRHASDQIKLRDTSGNAEKRIAQLRSNLAEYRADLAKAEAAKPDTEEGSYRLTLDGKTYDDRDEANAALGSLAYRGGSGEQRVGTYRGLALYHDRNMMDESVIKVGDSRGPAKPSLSSIEYATRPSSFKNDIHNAETWIRSHESDKATAEAQRGQAFKRAAELAKKKADLADVVRRMREQSATPAAEGDGEPGPGGRRPGARGGYVDLGGIIDAGGAVAREITAIPKELFDRWSEPLIDVVDKQAGAVGKAMANLARLASDDARAYIGQFQPALDKVLFNARGLPWDRAGRKALASLEEIAWNPASAGEYGVSRFRDAVEGVIPDTAMTTSEYHIVDSFRELMQQTGKAAQAAGMKAYDHKTGTWTPFVPAAGGRRLIRRPTDEYYDLMVGGKGTDAWDTLAEALAVMNGMSKPAALSELDAMSQQGLYARGAFEAYRTLKRFPDYLRVSGTIIPLLHATPFAAATSVARGTALRLGYANRFGQDVPGTAGQVSTNARAEAFVKAGGKQEDAENLLRALNGVPIDAGRWFEPGKAGYLTLRGFDVVSTFLQGAALSKNFIPNATEIVGKIPAMFGAKRTVRALARVITSPREASRESAASGARSVNIANLRPEPGKVPEYAARIAGHSLAVVGHFMNEFNELVAAQAGRTMADDLEAGLGTKLDESRLRVMGYSEPEIKQLVAGAAPPKLARSVETRAAERTQGSTSLPAELSRARSSRAYRRVVNFDSYAQMTANRTMKVLAEPIRGMASGDPRRTAAGAAVASQYLLGSLLSGAGAILLGILAKYGVEGVKQASEQMAEHPLRFAREAMFQTLVAGPLQAAVDLPAAHSLNDAVRTVMAASTPLTVLGDIVEAAAGWGRYRDMSPGERVAAVVSRRFSANSLARPLGVAAGWRANTLAQDAAIASYWKWRRTKGAAPTYVAKDDVEHAKFRSQMAQANKAIVEGSPAAVVQRHLDAAAGTLAVDDVEASLRSRLLLAGLKPDELADLRSDVGPTAFAELEAFDKLVAGFDRKGKLKQELEGKPGDEVIDRAFDAQDAGRVTESQRRAVVNELTRSPLVQEVSKLPIDKAMQRFRRSTLAERKEMADTLYGKIRRDRDHPESTVDGWLKELDEADKHGYPQNSVGSR